VFADVDELHTALLDMEPKSFVSRYILEPVPFAFSGDLQLWIDWKETLADLLYIDAYDIVMTGSASMGYSLNPMKSFKAFDNLSDIDCGVISEHYFNVAWRHLRQSQVAWLGYLHGPQNKKDKLDQYYQAYEEQFEDRDRLVSAFRKVTSEISRLLPRLTGTRWRKKSDFYTLFLELARREQMIPRDDGDVATLRERVVDFGSRVDSILLLEQESWQDQEPDVVAYARNVARAASDRGSRMVRAAAFSHFVFGDDAQLSQPAVEGVNGDEDPAEPSESTEASAGGSPTT
jgi:hypothetical protein